MSEQSNSSDCITHTSLIHLILLENSSHMMPPLVHVCIDLPAVAILSIRMLNSFNWNKSQHFC